MLPCSLKKLLCIFMFCRLKFKFPSMATFFSIHAVFSQVICPLPRRAQQSSKLPHAFLPPRVHSCRLLCLEPPASTHTAPACKILTPSLTQSLESFLLSTLQAEYPFSCLSITPEPMWGSIYWAAVLSCTDGKFLLNASCTVESLISLHFLGAEQSSSDMAGTGVGQQSTRAILEPSERLWLPYFVFDGIAN